MPEDDRAVRSYVGEAVPDCSADRITGVDRLSSGENHAVYGVSYLDPKGEAKQVVVRVASGDAAAGLRAQREARVLRKVGGVAGPELYDFRHRSPWFVGPAMCMEFIPGDQRELIEVRPDDMRRLGVVVQTLHALPVDDLHDWVPSGVGSSAYIEERWDGHLAARLPSIRDPLAGPLQRRLREAVDLVTDSLDRLQALVASVPEENLVLLHADISGANLIWAPQPVLIDWEYARLGDPADEVAYLFTQNQLTLSQRAAFWRGYASGLQAPRLDLIVDRVRLWEPITLLGSILWWLEAWSRVEQAATDRTDTPLPRPAEYYLGQAVRRLDEFDVMFARTTPRD